MNKQKFKELITELNLDPANYNDGKILKVLVNEKDNTWTIFLNFKAVIKVKDLNLLEERLINYFKTEAKINDIIVKYSYQDNNLSKEFVEEYYNFFLDYCKENRPRYTGLKTFNSDFFHNEIKVFVANKIEEEMVNNLLTGVKEFFDNYGLDIEVSCSHSPFQTPLEEEIKERIEKDTKQALLEQHLYEQQAKNTPEKEKVHRKRNKLTKEINGPITPLKEIPASEVELIEYQQKHTTTNFVIEGDVIEAVINEPKGYKIYEGVVYDGEDSIIIKSFLNDRNGDEAFYREHCIAGKRVRVFGSAVYDRFSRDIVINIREILGIEKTDVKRRVDLAPVKRVELHAHSKMSTQDGVVDIEEYMDLLKQLGHKAIAITDHYNVQALPDLDMHARKAGIKPIFGLEGALVDEDKFKIALTEADIDLKTATYVVYDVETTGLSSIYDDIIEIAAVKIQNGFVVDEFSTFVKPKRKISSKITEITSITEDDVRSAPPIEEVIIQFNKFIEGAVLVAHNATFDNSHLYRNLKDNNLYVGELPTIDTMQLARVYYGDKLKTFNLKALAKHFDVELTQHHRAIYDAKTLGNIFLKMLGDLEELGITNYNKINSLIDEEEAFKFAYPTHFTLLAKNRTGLKNLYKIVSDSHTNHFYREPRILKKVLEKHREGLLIGSGCGNGDIFDIASRDSYEKLLDAVDFYDFLEIQPVSHYKHILDSGDPEYDEECIKDAIKRIIKAGKEKNKLVVATGDVHILNKEDLKFREIFINAPQVGGGLHPLYRVEEIPYQNYLTTEEMLAEFMFLDELTREEVVITNTNKIADMVEEFPLFPNQLFAPSDDFMKDMGVPSFKEAVHDLTYSKAKELYGENLPKYIEDRINKELDSIIGNNYASIYYISHLLVKRSKDAGYVVGSRGSVGSSLVAFFMGITEVNGLVPHYYCKKCHFSAFKFNDEEKKLYEVSEEAKQFEEVLQTVGTGFDLPDATCPTCGHELEKDGVDIPFETFLGFDGDKVPDIDLNFSGEYQARAHEFCRELFGEDNAFRAGTISTIASRTAYGYVKGYLERKGIQARTCEINRLANKITGVKRSTGQHPGGIVVIPKEIEYSDITPVQYPADDLNAPWRTTHYDYHKFEDNLLKLDILGHDDPTMIRFLMNFVEANPSEFPFKTVEEIPLSDKKVLSIFSGLTSLGVESTQIHQVVGTTGIPEFGTQLTKEMLSEINPQTVDDLIKISGLSHGTDVWNGNARDYMLGKKPGVPPVPFKDLIGCRDDIMVYLIKRGLSASDAFEIMESVRKGRGVTVDQEKMMLKYNVPKWYIDSCKAIKYMFPKAHAAAYVIMALRIAWFKVYKPLYYYSAFFSRRANQFDVVVMASGYSAIKLKVKELEEKIMARNASNKEQELYNTLLLALEMTARGYTFKQVDIFKSEARDFVIEDNSLRIPFSAVDSLGISTANSITDARNEAPFTSIRDVLNRTKINTTLYERLLQLGTFGKLPQDDQIGLF